MTAIERILKAKSLSGLISQGLVLHWAPQGNQHSLLGSTAKPVVVVWYLLANADSLMMKTHNGDICNTEPTRQVLLHQRLFKSNKNTVLSSKDYNCCTKSSEELYKCWLTFKFYSPTHTHPLGGEDRSGFLSAMEMEAALRRCGSLCKRNALCHCPL